MRRVGVALAVCVAVRYEENRYHRSPTDSSKRKRCGMKSPPSQHPPPGTDENHPLPVTANAPREGNVVLVVDDEGAMRRLLTRILSKRNLEVLTAGNAAQARDIFNQRAIDLMLCDLMMPGEPGQSLIQHVVRAYPDTAVVVVTGLTEPGKAEPILHIGVLGYLIKPFDKNQVLITVANALRLRALERRDRIRREALEKEVREKTHDLIDLHETLQERQREMQEQELSLRDATGTVRTLLSQQRREKADFETVILENVRQSVQPFIQKLKATRLSPTQENYLEALEMNLEDIISPFIKAVSSSYLNLTPTELQVADLIRQGRRTKDIAVILNLSPNTVMTHRYHLRDKLGLKNKSVSLTTYLKTLEQQSDTTVPL